MKKLTILLVGLVFLAGSAFGQTFSDPVEYLNYFMAAQNDVVVKSMAYNSKSVHSKNAKRVEKRRRELIEEIKTNIKEMNRLTPYEGGEDMRDKAAKVMELILDIYEVEYKEASELKDKSEASYEGMERYFAALDKAEGKLEKANDQFDVLYEEFAKDHDIQLLDSDETKFQEQVKRVSELNEYSRKLFLAHFRVSRDDSRVNTAMSDKDWELAHAAREDLVKHSKEKMAEVNQMKPFHGDDDYRQSVLEVLKVYHKLGTKYYKRLIELNQKETLTNKDVNEYNEIVADINKEVPKAVEKMNKENEKIQRKNTPRRVKG